MSSSPRAGTRLFPDVAVGVLLVALALLPIVRGSALARSGLSSADAPFERAIEASTRRALVRGELPLWDGLQFAGRPLFADADTRVLYPPFVLFRFLPLRWFLPVLCVLHLWIAGFGVYLCCRAQGLDRLPSAAGAAALVIAVLADVGLPYANTVYAIAWLPWVFLLAGRSAAHRSNPDPALVIVAALGMLASRHAWWYVVATTGAAYLLRRWSPSAPADGARPRLLVQWVALVCIASGLAAFQLLPSANLARSRASSGGTVRVPEPDAGPTPRRDATVEARARAMLTSGQGGRILTACEAAGLAAAMIENGLPSAEGRQGTVSADYRDVFDLLDGAPSEDARAGALFEPLHHAPTRQDLLRLFDVEYLLSCDPPASVAPGWWTPVMAANGQWLYRAARQPQRAVWTCGVRRVGRRQLEYLLLHRVYDDTLTLRETGPPVNVRWAPQVDEAARRNLEATFHLGYGEFVGERTWRYRLLDASGANITAIVTNTAVEDTAGLDRGRLSVAADRRVDLPDEPKSEWVVGLDPCPASSVATVGTTEQPNGDIVMNTRADRDGVVFVSEAYDPQRSAWVDGRRVQALKVDLAFTGIRVPAGRHRVEVRSDAGLVRAGIVVTALTAVLTVWIGVGSRSRS